MAVMDPVLARIERLRALEAGAAADPGYEEDHNHVESDAFRAYDEAWRALPRLLNAEPKPEIWIAVDRWCGENPHHFGDAVYPNVHQVPMGWNREGRSLRSALLDAILMRAEERLARPEDALLWPDPRTTDLLRTLASRPLDQRFASILALLPSARPVSDALPNGALKTQVAELRGNLERFEVLGLEVAAGGLGVEMRVAFRERIAPNNTVILDLVDRDTRASTGLTVELARRRSDDPLSAHALSTWLGARSSIQPGEVRVTLSRAGFEQTAREKSGVFSVWVRGANPWFVAGAVNASALPSPVAAALKAVSPVILGRRVLRWFGAIAAEPRPVAAGSPACELCGDEMDVVLNGHCPACETTDLSPGRPLYGPDAEQHAAVTGAWAETRCPHCGARAFRRRCHSKLEAAHPFYHAWRCEGCGKGWLISEGLVEGRDWLDQALAAPEPGLGWKALMSDVARTGMLYHCHGDIASAGRFVRMADGLRSESVGPEWRALLLRLADALEFNHRSPLIFDSSDREHYDDCVTPVLEAARRMRELLGGASSA